MSTLTRWATAGTAAFLVAAVTLTGCTAESEPTAANSDEAKPAETVPAESATAATPAPGPSEAPTALAAAGSTEGMSPEEAERRRLFAEAQARARAASAGGGPSRDGASPSVAFGSAEGDVPANAVPTAGTIDPERAAPASQVNSFRSAASSQERKELDAAKTLEEARLDRIRVAEKELIASGGPATDGPSVIAEPASLELGMIPTGSSGRGVVRLTNRSVKPVTLLDCKSSCGCTTANCSKNKELLPGEFTEVEIKLDGGSTARKLEKNVTFMFSDGVAPLRVSVKGESIAYVQAEPERLDPTVHPDGRVVLKSVDGEPFVVRSSFPAVLEDQLPTEPAAEHVFHVSWDKIKEGNHRTRRMLFRVDHENADRVMVNLNIASLFPRTDGAAPAPTAPGMSTPAAAGAAGVPEIDRLLSQGDEEAVLGMLDAGEVEINVKDAAGQTPLTKAARWGAANVIHALVERGSDIEAEDTLGRTPLMYACQSKNLDAVQALLDAGADVVKQDRLGNNALSWAAGFGTAEIVREVLDAGAAVEVSGELIGFTPLIWAAGFGEAESVRILLEAGANIEARDTREGLTVFLHAARTGKDENIRVLAEAGADLAATSNAGRNAYLVAARNANVTVSTLHVLEELGLSPDAEDNDGRTALDLALSRNDGEAPAVIAYLKQRLDSADEDGGEG